MIGMNSFWPIELYCLHFFPYPRSFERGDAKTNFLIRCTDCTEPIHRTRNSIVIWKQSVTTRDRALSRVLGRIYIYIYLTKGEVST